jgi:hypothetical protein
MNENPVFSTNMYPTVQPLAPEPAPGQVAAQPQSVPPGTTVVYQPVATAPVAVPQPVPAPVPQDQHAAGPDEGHRVPDEILLYSHSTFFYWWPVWTVGYVMALLTWLGGTQVALADTEVLIHPSKNLGVIFTLTFFLVIMITNLTLRGTSSVVAILLVIIATLTLAYFQLWDIALHALGRLAIYMNLGFYLFFATAVFLVWAFTFFFYDRLTYWRVRKGQITQERVIGTAERSFDTRGMVFEKHQEDLFRHWVLGMGSGDLQISTTGAKRETIDVSNVLFVNHKLDKIQRMIAIKPDNDTK